MRVLSGWRVWVRFADGVEGEVDLGHLAGKGVFELWNDREQFERVRIGDYGELVWDDQVDLCPDALYLRVTGRRPEELSGVSEAAHRHA